MITVGGLGAISFKENEKLGGVIRGARGSQSFPRVVDSGISHQARAWWRFLNESINWSSLICLEVL